MKLSPGGDGRKVLSLLRDLVFLRREPSTEVLGYSQMPVGRQSERHAFSQVNCHLEVILPGLARKLMGFAMIPIGLKPITQALAWMVTVFAMAVSANLCVFKAVL